MSGIIWFAIQMALKYLVPVLDGNLNQQLKDLIQDITSYVSNHPAPAVAIKDLRIHLDSLTPQPSEPLPPAA